MTFGSCSLSLPPFSTFPKNNENFNGIRSMYTLLPNSSIYLFVNGFGTQKDETRIFNSQFIPSFQIGAGRIRRRSHGQGRAIAGKAPLCLVGAEPT